MESGDKAGAKAILDAVDMNKVKDPYHLHQLGDLISSTTGKGAEAVDLLTKLIAQFPTTNELYYYRGRAYVAADRSFRRSQGGPGKVRLARRRTRRKPPTRRRSSIRSRSSLSP